MPTSYVPTDGRIPWLWPQGTGVLLRVLEGHRVHEHQVCQALECSGCDRAKARDIAAVLAREGYYAARVTTTAIIAGDLAAFLLEAGLVLEIESSIPVGNTCHALNYGVGRKMLARQQENADLELARPGPGPGG